jgi:tetratricopeptide (TPR) repeat protein
MRPDDSPSSSLASRNTRRIRRCLPVKQHHPLSQRYWSCFAIAVVLLYIVFQAYRTALQGPFVFDDFSLPFYKRTFPTGTFKAWIAGVRPLLMVSYWLNFQISGRDSYSYHLLNLFLHIANAATVFVIVRRIMSCLPIERWRLELFSGFASALFLLHPIQTEAVAYVAGRSELLSAFFFFIAFATFLHAPPHVAITWKRSLLVLILFICALASKEHTAVLPILFLLTEFFWFAAQPLQCLRRHWRLYLPVLTGALIAVRFIWIEIKQSSTAGFDRSGVSWTAYALTECRVFFSYLRLLLFPVGQNFDYDLAWSRDLSDFKTLAAVLGVLFMGVIVWHYRKCFSVGTYGLIVFMILLAPTSSFIPIKDAMVEHRLYLPMLGFVLMACELIMHLTLEKPATIVLTSTVVIIASLATYQRTRVWASEAALWEDTAAKSPNKLRVYDHLVHGLLQERRCREALDRLSNLSQRLQPDAALLVHWSFAYECVNEPQHALEKLEQSVAKFPWPSSYVNMAREQIKLNRIQDAVQSLTRALELDPALESAYIMRAELLQRQGDYKGARRDYSHVLLNGNIDAPSDGAKVSGKVLTAGWAFSKGSPIVEMSIYVDNDFLAQASMKVGRPDVAKAFPEAREALESGWQAVVDTSVISAGQHTFTVSAKLLDGSLLEVGSISIVVSK